MPILLNGTAMASIMVESVECAAQLSRFLIEERGLTVAAIKVLQGDAFVLYYKGEEKPDMLEGFEYKQPVKASPLHSTLYNTKQAACAAAKYLLDYTPQVTIQLHPSASGEYMVIYDKGDVAESIRNSIPTDDAQEKPKLVGCTARTPQVSLTFGNMAEASVFLACLHTNNDGPEVTLKHEYGPTNAECRTTLEIMDARHFIVCMYALLWPFIKEPTFKPR